MCNPLKEWARCYLGWGNGRIKKRRKAKETAITIWACCCASAISRADKGGIIACPVWNRDTTHGTQQYGTWLKRVCMCECDRLVGPKISPRGDRQTVKPRGQGTDGLFLTFRRLPRDCEKLRYEMSRSPETAACNKNPQPNHCYKSPLLPPSLLYSLWVLVPWNWIRTKKNFFLLPIFLKFYPSKGTPCENDRILKKNTVSNFEERFFFGSSGWTVEITSGLDNKPTLISTWQLFFEVN